MAAPEHLSNLRPPDLPPNFVENGVPAGEGFAHQEPPTLPRQSWQGKLLTVSFAIFAKWFDTWVQARRQVSLDHDRSFLV